MRARNTVALQVEIKLGERVYVLKAKEPFALSGDRRRHRRQIAELITAQAEVMALQFVEQLGAVPIETLKGA